MKYRGVNYDIGTEYRRGESSRPVWNRGDVARDLSVIHNELHCTSVNLYGTDLVRLQEAAIVAHQEGLHVSLQLRSIDDSREGMLGRLAEAARLAEHLRRAGGVTLNVGCEMTLFTRGFVGINVPPAQQWSEVVYRIDATNAGLHAGAVSQSFSRLKEWPSNRFTAPPQSRLTIAVDEIFPIPPR